VKVVILHQHFHTPLQGGALRSYYLGKALVDRNVETIVITAHNSHAYVNENIEGIDVHYLPVSYNNTFGFYRRSFSFSRFVLGAIRLMANFRDADICYAISVPLTVGIAAMRIKKKYGVPFIFEVGDLWPDAPIQLGFIKNRIFQAALYRLEKRIYSNAAAIVALSEPIRDAIENKVTGKDIHLITNVSDTDFFKPEKKNQIVSAKYGIEEKFVVAYIGAIGFANGLDYFLECAKVSQHDQLPVHFVICGEGAMLSNLKLSAQRLELDNLTFISFKNREGVREIMNVTDANFICYRPSPILETGSPHKYFDGLAAGKLTIVNFGGWIKNEIEKSQCGFGVEAFDPSDFTRKIMPFIQNTEKTDIYRKSARHLAEEKYSRSKLSEKFYQLINGLV
jgi:glycosyltransferase involved in cell wall biosynthesis